MYDVVSIGGATVDIFIRTSDSRIISIREPKYRTEFLAFDYGHKIYVDDVIYSPGGGGNNTAVAFARLGLLTAFIGCIGQDEEGRRLLMSLKTEGIRTDFITRTSEQNTGLSIVLNSFEGDRTCFSYRGANNSLTRESIDWDELKKTKWLYIPSLSGASHDLLPELVAFAQKHKIQIACNPGNQQLDLGLEGLDFLIKACSILNINKEEAERLTGMRAAHRTVDESVCHLETMGGEPWVSDVREMLVTLHNRGAQVVVITEGIKGAQVFDGEQFYWMPVYPYKPTDTLGAGDAFAASFVAGMITEKGIKQSLKIAAANSSHVVQKFGAQPGLATMQQIETLINKHSTIQPLAESVDNLQRSLSWG